MKFSSFSFPWLAAGILALAMAANPQRALAVRPLGTDVSGYQTNVDWTLTKNAGVSFAWAKATEGTGYINPYFASQEAGAKRVGVFIGAYHFARPSSHPNITGASSADSEAIYFWSTASNYVKACGNYLVPMLDWEDPLVTNQLSTATMSAWVNEWCNWVSNAAYASGVVLKPVVYTGTWYSQPSGTYSGLNSSVTTWPSWIAAYPTNPNAQTGAPSNTYPWPTWNIWQYADTNWSGGDADVFNGTLASFLPTFVLGNVVITNNPTNVTVTPGSTATFSATAAGQTPLVYQWFFNGAAIPGATSSICQVTNAQPTNAGGYYVVVTNSIANSTSVVAGLSVTSPLTNSPGSILAATGMVHWWPGDGNGVDIFAAKNATPHLGISYGSGKQNLSFKFDGTSGYLTTGLSSIAVPWTACFWVNRQNAPGVAAAITGDGKCEIKLEQYNGTRQVGFTTFGVADYNFGYTVPQNTWTHLAFVASGTQMQLYANGALVGTLSTNRPLPCAYLGAGYVNSNGNIVDYMRGSLDEIVLFNRALSLSEIQAAYAAGSAGFVRAPEFTGPQAVGVGQFQTGLKGQTGKNFTIYSSTDLSVWTSLGSFANPAGAIQFTNNAATNLVKVYRATQP